MRDDDKFRRVIRNMRKTNDLKAAATQCVDAIDEWQVSRATGCPDIEHEKAKLVTAARSRLRDAVANI